MTFGRWEGKRVLIIGAARQGLALARYLARHGASILLNDKRTPEQLAAEMAETQQSGSSIEWVTGGHPLSAMAPRPDLVCVSGGIPLDNPLVVFALSNGIPLSNDTQIFMDVVPCKTVGITGSAGKTTTTTLVGRIARAASSAGRIWVGGNIGDPLINYVDEMQPNDLAILEISSFQSELMQTSPNVAAILNITPNHLDRHGTMEEYIAAKARVIKYQSAEDYTILGRDDPNAWNLSAGLKSHLISFGFGPLPDGQDGSFVENNDQFFLRENGKVLRLPVEDSIELRGKHNQLNVLAACTIAHAAGFGPQAMLAGIKDFRGVPHRLEFVRTWRGAHWYNDSIATAPERTTAAIKSFDGPLILLLGGRDKNLPWEDLAKLVRQRVDHLVIFGQAAEKIQTAIGTRIPGAKPYSVTRVEKCQQAVAAAARLAQPGFVVLFSPGGTSYDEFKDFEERGERYKQWVLEFSETLR
jgi:UDP-N-acetylmuramoylalanine--D-glutamate ligase